MTYIPSQPGAMSALFFFPFWFEPTHPLSSPLQTHLPGYVKDNERLRSQGVGVVACVAVNDAFVMAAWEKSQNATGKVRMLADTCGEFTKVHACSVYTVREGG